MYLSSPASFARAGEFLMTITMKTPTAIQFGAGNIGRGFLAQLFHESGFEVVFADVAEPLLQAINNRGEYTIQIVGDNAEDVPINTIRAIHSRDVDAIASELASSQIVCTAVGANVLPHLAPAIAQGLILRHRQNSQPINILLCENLHDAASLLRTHVSKHLPEAERDTILLKTGFVQAVVSRMVPAQTEAEKAKDILGVRVEAYKRLPIDANAIVGDFPKIAGVEPVSNFLAYVERKLYTHNCAHAILGYLGHSKGYNFGYEALQDEEIRALLTDVLRETGEALLRKHHFDPETHQNHVLDLLHRFENRSLGDTCLRLARDPIRKLAIDDRLVGSARLCELEGIEPTALVIAIVTALRHDDPSDPSTLKLQATLAEHGIERVLTELCGLPSQEPLHQKILNRWRQTA